MDIIRCPVCGHGLSSSDYVCPCCHTRLPGAEIPWFQVGFTVIIAVIVLIVLTLAFFGW